MGKQPDFLKALAEGRSTRRQFWSFYGFAIVPALGLTMAGAIGRDTGWSGVLFAAAAIWLLLFLVPVTAAMARRFHDIGRTGWWALPQLGIALAAIMLVMSYGQIAKRPFSASCWVGTSIVLPGLRSDALVERSSDEDCAAEQKARDAYDARQNIVFSISLGAALLAHIVTLLFLVRPSEPGTNAFGPNPNGVTE